MLEKIPGRSGKKNKLLISMRGEDTIMNKRGGKGRRVY
jgi:hypothetical protein